MNQSFRRISSGLPGVLAFLLAPLAALAQPPATTPINKDEVKFDSFDGVELHGTFYPASGGTKSPCVLLIHKIGGNRNQAGWEDLAVYLQKKDFAVLSFDLRGHGESLTVNPNLFW